MRTICFTCFNITLYTIITNCRYAFICVFQVELEGWVRLWEDPNGIPSVDVSWLKEDVDRGLFTPVHTYKDITGQLKKTGDEIRPYVVLPTRISWLHEWCSANSTAIFSESRLCVAPSWGVEVLHEVSSR